MEMLNRAYKIRIYPTREQQEFLNKTLGSCRAIYNMMLYERKQVFEQLKINENRDELYKWKYKTEKQYKEEYEWLKDADSFALQQARRNLVSAYSNFFKSTQGLRKGEKVGFPKFKSKHSHCDSYRTAQTIDIDWEEQTIRIPKCKSIKYKSSKSVKSWYRQETTKLKNITISKSASGKYFASLLFEGEKDYTGIKKPIEKTTGLDMSLQNFYVDEQGNSPEYNRNYRNYENRLGILQSRLALKTKGSKGYEKARIKVAKLHEHIANKRRDFNHQLSHKLIMENDCIVVEHLSLKGMSQALNLGKSVMDLGYSSFISMLLYKAEWNEKTVMLADKWFASSKTCSTCGFVKKDLMLHEREWDCPICNSHHNRDQNAAINLKNLGISLVEHQEVLTENSNFAASKLEYPTL
jgi:putative transposase